MAEQLEKEILAILLEAGEENLPALVNTVGVQRHSPPKDSIVAEVGDALDDLLRKSLIELTWYDDGWVPLTDEEQRAVLPVSRSVGWDAAANVWTWNEQSAAGRRPVVVLTPAGERQIRTLLASDPGTVDG